MTPNWFWRCFTLAVQLENFIEMLHFHRVYLKHEQIKLSGKRHCNFMSIYSMYYKNTVLLVFLQGSPQAQSLLLSGPLHTNNT